MKIVYAVTPAAGHLTPLLDIARMTVARGDEAVVITATCLKPSVEKAGLRFSPLAAAADRDFRRLDETFPDRAGLTPGPEQLIHDFTRIFVDTMQPQAETLRAAIADERPDVVVVDSFFFGATALYLDRARPRPPIVTCGVSPLMADRPDGAPHMLGLHPAVDEETRAQYTVIAEDTDAVFNRPLRSYLDAKLAAMGLPSLPCSVLHSRHLMADAYLVLTTPAFEYDRDDLPDHVHFVGAAPRAPNNLPHPDWWGDLDAGKQAVAVTQGTVSNSDFSELVEPTLAALADRDDLLVLVTTGGRPVERVGGPIPKNARIAEFWDFEAVLPRVDALVTNGGYGTVQQALRAGVPIVAAGRSEDKADVGARVAWSGVGIEIPSQRPSVANIRDAVGRVLTEPSYRDRVRAIAADLAAIDTRAKIFGVLDDLVDRSVGRMTEH